MCLYVSLCFYVSVSVSLRTQRNAITQEGKARTNDENKGKQKGERSERSQEGGIPPSPPAKTHSRKVGLDFLITLCFRYLHTHTINIKRRAPRNAVIPEYTQNLCQREKKKMTETSEALDGLIHISNVSVSE